MALQHSNISPEPLVRPHEAIFRRFLKQHGLKFTPERAKILDAVLAKEGVFEADELTYEMRESGHRVSKATIYRTLKHLLDADIVREVLIDPKQIHYQRSFGQETTGHLVCVEVNQVIEFPAPQLEQLAEQICREHGYDMLHYRFVVYGAAPEADETADGQ